MYKRQKLDCRFTVSHRPRTSHTPNTTAKNKCVYRPVLSGNLVGNCFMCRPVPSILQNTKQPPGVGLASFPCCSDGSVLPGARWSAWVHSSERALGLLLSAAFRPHFSLKKEHYVWTSESKILSKTNSGRFTIYDYDFNKTRP